MSYLLPFLSVLLGYGFAIWFKPEKKSQLKLLLAFSGAFLLSLTVMHLLPEVYAMSESVGHAAHEGHHHHDHSAFKSTGIFIMIGILFQIVLEFFSKGAEHGHVHVHDAKRVPWLLFISLCIHALFEGFPIYNHHDLAWGIAIHHLPIAVILTIFFTKAGVSSRLIFLFMLIFAAMTPLGTWLAHNLPMAEAYNRPLTAIVIGILIHISSTIIFESSENHKFNIAKISAIVIGIVLAAFL